MATKTANNLLFAQAFNTQYNIWSNIITRRSFVRLLLGVEYLDFFKKNESTFTSLLLSLGFSNAS